VYFQTLLPTFNKFLHLLIYLGIIKDYFIVNLAFSNHGSWKRIVDSGWLGYVQSCCKWLDKLGCDLIKISIWLYWLTLF